MRILYLPLMKKIMFNDRYGLTNAVLGGRKTQTRRIKFDEYLQEEALDADAIGYGQGCCEMWWDGRILHQIPSRYKIGEVVAVAQRYCDVAQGGRAVDSRYDAFRQCNWGEGKDGVLESSLGWKNKMYVRADLMPHRIRITDVRVERLQEITDDNCSKEGISYIMNAPLLLYGVHCDTGMICLGDTPREAYAELIDKISGKGTWESNPYVFVYDFELVK